MNFNRLHQKIFIAFSLIFIAMFLFSGNVIAGTCGSSSGGSFTTVPTSNLCASGTASQVSIHSDYDQTICNGSGPWPTDPDWGNWHWWCDGEATSCSASDPNVPTKSMLSSSEVSYYTGSYSSPDVFEGWYEATCGGSWPYTPPAGYETTSCTTGTTGSHGGCSCCIMSLIKIEKTAACGTSNGGTFASAPSSNLCSLGSASSVTTNATTYDWTCSSTGASISCSSNKEVTATCGSSDGQTYVSAPTTNLCSSGTASAVGGEGPWEWTCAGTPAGWYNGDWFKRKKITVNNPGTAMTDYQYQIGVTYDSDMQADFDDLRFTTSDGHTLLSYWLESKTDSTTATVWVKIPNLANGNTDIYMYYGNPSATSTSNADNTFIFFDDFESDSVGVAPSKWVVDQSTDTTIKVSSDAAYAGSKSLKLYKNGETTMSLIKNFVSPLPSQTVIEYQMRSEQLATNGTFNTRGSGLIGARLALWNDASIKYYDGSAWVATGKTYSVGQWFKTIVTLNNNTYKYSFALPDESYIQTDINYSSNTYQDLIYFLLSNSGSYSYYIDSVIVRNYTSAEISSVLSLEQSNSAIDYCATAIVPGVCGSSDGSSFASAPTTNLCSDGTPSLVSDNLNTFDWTCTGGATASWLEGYDKRKPVTVTSSSELTDYQVKVVVAYDSDMQADFDDIRFTSSTGTTQLNYWLESKTDSATATFWVKVPSVSNGNTTIYMYYGNASATSASSGANTFTFFDDFNSGTINTNKWVTSCVGSDNGGSVSIVSNELVVTARSSCYASCKTVCYARSLNTFDIRDGYAVQYYSKQYEGSGEGNWWRAGFFLSDVATPPYDPAGFPSIASSIIVTQNLVTYPSNPPSLCVADRISSSSAEGCTDAQLYWSANFGGNHTFTVGINESVVNVFADGTQLVTNASHRQSSTYNKYLYFLRGADQSIYATQRFDNVLVRKYVPAEPTTSVGEEDFGVSIDTCSAYKDIAATCGSSNGGTFSTTPTNLCSSGTASEVSFSTTWDWTCSGISPTWYGNWLKRKSITVSNSGSSLTDYQVNLTVAYDSDMQTDFDDLRFTTSDGITELNYWLESKTDSTTAKIWVKIPTLVNGDNTIYMYYGNASVATASDGDETFTFFDDFSGSAIDTSKWTVDSSTGFSVGSGVLTGTNTTGRIRSIQTFGTGVSLEIKEKTTSLATNGHIIGGFWTSASNGITWLDHPTNWYYRNDSTWVNTSAPVTGVYHRIVTKTINSTQVSMGAYVYDTNADYWVLGIISNAVSNEPIMIGRRPDSDSFLNQSYNATWDWVFVRKSIGTDPTASFNTEESNALIASCSANVEIADGVCGTANGQSFGAVPTTNLCSAGIASSVTNNTTTYDWTCIGIGTSSETASCSAGKTLNGICGFSHGAPLTSIPTTNLCNSGTPSVVSGSGPWNWTCSGFAIGSWYDLSWTKRKSITVSSLASLTDYQIALTVPFATGMQTDFDDIRFTSSDGITELNYWLEYKTDSTTAKIWVKIPTLLSGVNTIYMYYGNSSASSVSNGDNTFDFFDHFDTASLDLNKWTNGGIPTFSNSVVYINNNQAIIQKNSIPMPIIFEVKYQRPSYYRNRTNSVPTPSVTDWGDFSPSLYWGGWTGSTLANNTWYLFRHIYNGSGTFYWKINNYGGSEIFSRSASYSGTSAYLSYASTESESSQLRIDFALARKYAATEPSFVINSEEVQEESSTACATATVPICGSSDGGEFLTEPTTDLCSVGVASEVSLTTTWNWTCSANSWYNESWMKRKPINISNSGSSLTDYQVNLTVAYDSDMQTDFDDLRFTTSDGITELNYWLESKTDSAMASIWIKIPSLANGSNTIYMYYGNSSATTTSDGDNTFDLFDHFLGSSLDSNKWVNRSDQATGLIMVTGSQLWILSANDDNKNTGVRSVDTFPANTQFIAKIDLGGGGTYAPLSKQDPPWYGDASSQFEIYGQMGASDYGLRVVSNKYNFSGAPFVPYKLMVSWLSTTVRLQSDQGDDSGWQTKCALSYPNHIAIFSRDLSTTSGGIVKVDYIFARNYTATEPTNSFGSEETNVTNSTSCSANQSVAGPLPTTLQSPTQINSDDSCWYCTHYYTNESDASTLTVGKSSQLDFKFTYDDSEPTATLSYYMFSIGTSALQSGATYTTSWIPASGAVGTVKTVASAVSVKNAPTLSNDISYGSTYHWWFKVKNDSDIESDWVEGTAFTTPSKHWPIVRIVADKSAVTIGSDVQYCTTLPSLDATEDPCYPVCWTGSGSPSLEADNSDWKCSICYNSSNQPVLCGESNSNAFTWAMPTGTTFQSETTLSSPNPILKYDDPGDDLRPRLKITGSDCSGEGSGVNSNLPVPKWIEVP